MLLRLHRIATKLLGTVALLAVVGGLFAAQADVGPERRENHPKPADTPDTRMASAVQLRAEVLCERTQFHLGLLQTLDVFANHEGTTDAEDKRTIYSLSSITVPRGGWKIDAVAIYTSYASRPEGWLKLKRARLNVFSKKAEVPAAADDPRLGREVKVTVRKTDKSARDGSRTLPVYEVRAYDLRLTLQPGEYWIGLTPILSAATGVASHLCVQDVHDARFDDVSRNPGGGFWSENWAVLGPASNKRLGMHLSLDIEGWRVPRGRALDWPVVDGKSDQQLHLRFGTFDPLANPPKVPKDLMQADDGNLWIIQCRRTVDQAVRDQLTRAGAALLRYLPDDAYVARLAPAAVAAIRRLADIRWVGPYHPAYRLDPNVFQKPDDRPGHQRLPMWERAGHRQILVHLFDRDVGAKKLVAQVIRDAGGSVLFQSPRGLYLAADVPLDGLGAVARCDAVCGIERRFDVGYHQAPAVSDEVLITLAQIRELSGADVIKKSGGYEGLGVRVGVLDDRVREDHVDLLARPLTILGPPFSSNANHGTAIASILCGEGRGDPRARGLLALGGLVFTSDRADPLHIDCHGGVQQFVQNPQVVVLSSSSGGGLRFPVKHYDGWAVLLDDLVLEYDLLICQAIGNTSGRGNGVAGSWAKNALLAGAVHPRGSLRREDHRPVYTSGPAPDGRVKPDLVHFGQDVFCANASSPRGYGRFGGTSCATPLVAGHCGLMMEMWADGVFGNLPLGRSVFDRKPHAATGRALMINSAYRYPIEGKKPIFTRFQQGWGMPDLARLYESRKKLFIVDQEVTLHDHQAVEYQVGVPANEPELRVSLVYTDPLGMTTATKALVNDLDLIVIAPDGTRYFGNHGLLDGNVSRAGGTPDRINNVENVFLEKPVPGIWRVVVAAHRIAWNQHGGTTAWGQDFALVVCGVEPDPVPTKSLRK